MKLAELLANDNTTPPPGERVIAKVLTTSAVIEEHVGRGLDAMLAASGATPQFQSAISEFMRPVVALLADMEKSVIEHVRGREAEREIDHDR